MSVYNFEFNLTSINGEPANEENVKPFFKALTDASQGTPEEPDLYPRLASYQGGPPFRILMKIKGE